MTIKILAISGGLRAASSNTALLRAAQQLAPEGVEIEIYEGLRDLPYFDEDLESDVPAAVTELRSGSRPPTACSSPAPSTTTAFRAA